MTSPTKSHGGLILALSSKRKAVSGNSYNKLQLFQNQEQIQGKLIYTKYGILRKLNTTKH